jgi:hypothetical protein
MNIKLEFDNYWELLALHKSLMAVKFDPDAYLKEAQGSPFTSSLAFKVFDLLVSSSKEQGKAKQADNWLTWQVADKSRIETQLLLKRISESDWWADADEEFRKRYVVEFMAPLILEANIQSEIIKNG